jgi:putative membrane protein
MGGMMGPAGGWTLLWILLALALVSGSVLGVRVLSTRHSPEPPYVGADDSPAVQEAKDALRRRYANGEITREEYLQGKVELED